MFDDMIADMESNKKLSPILFFFANLFLRRIKLNILLAIISNLFSKSLKL